MIQKPESLLLLFLLICSIPFSANAQKAAYFPDRLIIKYESDQNLQQIRLKQGTHPRAAVHERLNKIGALQVRPLLSERLQRSIRQKRLPSSDEVLRIQEIFFGRDINPVQLAAKISRMPGVAYAEPRYLRYLSATPNDPLIQKFVDTHNFTDAWDLSQGSKDITIAIVDGGVGYTHIDLDDNLWINQDEIPPALQPLVDQNSDGKVTSTEIKQYLNNQGVDHDGDGDITLRDALHDNSAFTDGIDNDNNDFTDDLFGWDFWAAGEFQGSISSDNDPFHDATDHGTHVAGIAAAETNNGEGLASAAYNATYMPVKAGGAPSDPDAVGFGFEGILYAAENGADIINCSWSGSSSSEAEKEVITLATEMGVLVVAAAGNDGSRVQYPARYNNTLAVGSVETDQTRSRFSNFGYALDVLATGFDILSTSYDNEYAPKAGTSMSTPVVSGLAALVKSIHPSWSGARIGMQIRASATDIDNANNDFFNSKLGHGSVDAYNALNTTLPGFKTVSHSFVDTNGDKLLLGESGFLNITLTNIGRPSAAEIDLQQLNGGDIDIRNAMQQTGSVATGDTVEISFGLSIPTNFNLTEIPTFRLNFKNNNQNYTDFNVLSYENLFYDILAGNNIKMSFGAEGTIGFSDPLSQRGGVGFIPRKPDGSGGFTEGPNLLFEGGLIVEVNGELYDAVRAEDDRLSRDFFPQDGFTVEPTNDRNGLTGSTNFITISQDSTRQALIDLQTYAYNEPQISNVVFVKYTIKNPSTYITMENVYAGIFNDWDIGPTAQSNDITYSEADSIMYISDSQPNSLPIVAVAHLGPISGALAIDNAIPGRPDSVTFGLYDGFEDGEKSSSLTSGTVRTEIQSADVSAVMASGPYILNPRAEVTVGFVYAFGDDIDQLRRQISEARSRNLFSVSPTGRAISAEIPAETRLFQNYPNPFQEETQIHVDLQQNRNVTLTIYDVLGRKIQVIVDKELDAGSHFFPFNPHALKLSTGIYFAHLEVDGDTQTIGMTYIKPK